MAAKYRDDNHTRISDKDIAAVKKAIKHESVSEGVDVDRRTKGFKAAMIRNEKSKKVREKYKKKKEVHSLRVLRKFYLIFHVLHFDIQQRLHRRPLLSHHELIAQDRLVLYS